MAASKTSTAAVASDSAPAETTTWPGRRRSRRRLGDATLAIIATALFLIVLNGGLP